MALGQNQTDKPVPWYVSAFILVAVVLIALLWIFGHGRCNQTSHRATQIRASRDSVELAPGGNASFNLWVNSSKDGPLRIEGPAFLTQTAQVINQSRGTMSDYIYDQTLRVTIRATNEAPPGEYSVTFVFPHNRALLEPWSEIATEVKVRIER